MNCVNCYSYFPLFFKASILTLVSHRELLVKPLAPLITVYSLRGETARCLFFQTIVLSRKLLLIKCQCLCLKWKKSIKHVVLRHPRREAFSPKMLKDKFQKGKPGRTSILVTFCCRNKKIGMHTPGFPTFLDSSLFILLSALKNHILSHLFSTHIIYSDFVGFSGRGVDSEMSVFHGWVK